MAIEYRIHPSLGVARLGNSSEFYLSPRSIGGRPIVCNEFGDETDEKRPQIDYVKKFKDKQKRVKKQAVKFFVYKHDTVKKTAEKIDLTDKTKVKSVKWTVHLANKKSAWFDFSEFKGDLMLGDKNTYDNRPPKIDGSSDDVDKRNASVEDKDRKYLITDFGPRTLDSPRFRLAFKDDSTVPDGYQSSPPFHQRENNPKHNQRVYPKYGKRVDYLGEIITDSKNDLVVLGGHGNSGGNEIFETFAGGETWYDDISDGPVVCEMMLTDGTSVVLDAWVTVGPPKFAPELVNITTLDDVMFDIAVKYFPVGKDLELYDKNNSEYVEIDENGKKKNEGWNPKYDKVNFERDIEPILKRIGHYRWVANVPSMMDFCMPSFDLRDKSEKNLPNRKRYFEYFRKSDEKYWGVGGDSEALFSTHVDIKNNKKVKDDYVNGIPLMPLNAGSNAVGNFIPDKFVELSRVQHFFLEQWSKGKFDVGKADDILGLLELDHADVGNCVGAPLCPGVEVTWSIKNPAIYSAPYRIKHRNMDPKTGKIDLKFYFKNGLDPNWDETAPEGMQGGGCEPGDLTKRMADPWVSDLFECNVNHINFTYQDRILSEDELEEPPTYQAYWWPPQSPWDVILGVTDPEEDDKRVRDEKAKAEIKAAGASAGQQVNYIRGIHNHIEMVYAWSYLGFIVNQNEGDDRDQYPYFVEKERNHEEFNVSAVAVAHTRNIVDPFGVRFGHGFHLKKDIVEFTESEKQKVT